MGKREGGITLTNKELIIVVKLKIVVEENFPVTLKEFKNFLVSICIYIDNPLIRTYLC